VEQLITVPIEQDLLNGVPWLDRIHSISMPVAMIRLSSRQVPLIDMSVLAKWKIRPRLMGVPGVTNVAVYGQRDRQLQVQVDPKRLGAERVSLTQLIETAGNALWVSPSTM
jgi:multidrug efflux pump subunit AcrB